MKRVAIVGLGLIGGSLGMALRRKLPEVEVVGIARRAATATLAKRRRVVHHASTRLADLAGADLVVIAVPLGSTAAVLKELAPHLDEGARVTDVGSAKASVVRVAGEVLDGKRNPFLGGHPMAGKEVTGVENAEPGLFQGKPWIFTPSTRTTARKVPKAFVDLWDAVDRIGALPVSLPAEEHDRYVALVSHVPFLVSAAFLLAAGRDKSWKKAAALASSGFRDLTRIGAGDPSMYTAIVESNRDAVLDAWGEFHQALDEFEADLVRGEEGRMRQLFEEARRVRTRWEKGRRTG